MFQTSFYAVRNNAAEGRYQKAEEVEIPPEHTKVFNWVEYGDDPDPDLAKEYVERKTVRINSS